VLGRPLRSEETERLSKYVSLLIKWQRSQRLVGSSDPEWIVDNIVLDSLLFTLVLPARCERILDIGSGAGVPGIPLSVVLPETSFTLLEARSKRVSFLAAAIREVPLRRCEVVNARLDIFVRTATPRYDCAVMRCAGDPRTLAAQAATLLAPGGCFIAAGPPKPDQGSGWREVPSPMGMRRFWVSQQT